MMAEKLEQASRDRQIPFHLELSVSAALFLKSKNMTAVEAEVHILSRLELQVGISL